MRYRAIVTSALVASTLARPHDDHEKRKIIFETVTETDYVNVFVTVADRGFQATSTPKTTPMFLFPDPRTRSTPVYWWPPPKSLTPAPIVKPSTPRTTATKPSSTLLPSSSKSSSTSKVSSIVASSSIQPSSSSPRASSTPSIVGGGQTPSSSVASSSSMRASIAATPSSSSAVIGPTHVSGQSQAYLTPASSDYQNAILYHHNARRANHNAGQMTWCSDCAVNAQIAAERCNFTHYIPSGVKNGQNLFITSGDVFNVTAGITEAWYKSELPLMAGHYGEPTPDDTTFEKVGHFTQIVWQGTTSVGCYSLDCGDHMIVGTDTQSSLNKYTVCNYSPPGNVRTQFGSNVLMPKQTTNLGSWTD